MTASDDQPRAGRAWPYLVIYFLAVAMPSAAMFQGRLGTAAALAYVAGVAVVVAALPRLLPLVFRIPRGMMIALAVAALIAIIGLFAVIYPRVNLHEPGKGSDRDDALNVGVNELLHGRYPYHARTYLGAPISPGPGALMQSIPFWLLGNAAYQNFFWLVAFVTVASKLLGDVRPAIALTLLTIMLSPTLVGLEVMTGGDYFANSLYVLTAACLILMSRTAPQLMMSGALLGLLLSSRANYLFILPILAAWTARHRGIRPAAACVFALFLILLAVSLPFYLHDPKNFGPLAAQNKLHEAGLDTVLPHADAVVALTLTLLTLALSLWLWLKRSNLSIAIAGCAVVLLYPSLLGLVLDCLKQRRLDFAFAGWSASATIFATLALAKVISAHQATASARCAADRPDYS